ncbi:phage tail protein [Providencia rettgeri]|uniref:phage tail protein n=1 Tax=Providencia rettgeri TaxID=587 RepID=UPI001B38C272|nr:phage tail protein [Providencia rettgeri]MBQ0313648.1 tail fiber protein [Providencia rettgeri]MBQ0322830.1 tail fiber protein [Providencia rettgeri]MBQ0350525.1 tail fiber protein [Providencia rettgeri]MBQ0404477.1 tail fiber protein [Providencia rettgeri]MCJ2226899.1 phage tail protein [Providencia rettgeri]
MQDLMPPINTPDSAFHDGDPTTGQLGTIVTALWLNNVQSATRDVQLEIKNVLAKAGIQPDPKKTNQLAEAISQIIGSGNYASTAYVDNGLNKKIDKANISGQKGNDNDKVPSLHLFTTEIGKLAVIGYSYSKIESDGRYQPKGNYAPAGDYATNTALNNGLNGKFDKTGGVVTGPTTFNHTNVRVNGTNDWTSLRLIKWDGSYAMIQTNPASDAAMLSITNRDKDEKTLGLVSIPNRSGIVMLAGDYGWGGSGETLSYSKGDELRNHLRIISTPSSIFKSSTFGSSLNYIYSAIAYFKSGNTFTAITANHAGEGVKVIGGYDAADYVYNLWTDRNTKIDRNGNLKVSGSSDELSDYPVGCPIPWPQSTAPAGFLVCNGQSFNKTTYPLLASAYPSGVLPDLRSEFLRGLDAGRGIDVGRTALSTQSDAMQEISGEVLGTRNSSGGGHAAGAFAFVSSANSKTSKAEWGEPNNVIYDFKASRVTRTANENRPRNIAFLYIVRAA